MSNHSCSRAPGRPLDEYYDALVDLYERGERDSLDGGVAAERFAAELGVEESSAQGIMHRLLEAGHAEAVWGVDPETSRPRQSYRPTDPTEGKQL
ncbi:hypothetical protein [Halostella sp. PRR32]|uniref:hypothetical protein n=1 Tax=Halostella sp. PRR32 TaxID=3098147 RepID=UPI002B1E6C49|nr:hypothetical protein [Halostella sp. PRR32]